MRINKLFSIFLLFLSCQYSFAGFSEKQMEVFPMIRALHGLEIEKNTNKLDKIFNDYRKIIKNNVSVNFTPTSDCQIYFDHRKKINFEIENIYADIIRTIDDETSESKYLKTRFEMLLNYNILLDGFAHNNSEGGVQTKTKKGIKCVVNKEVRKAWLNSIDRSQSNLKRFQNKRYGIRTFKTLHEDSTFYAQENVDNANYELNKFYAMSAVSIMALPIMSYYVPTAIASSATALGLGAKAIKYANLTIKAPRVIMLSYIGGKAAIKFLELKPKLIIQTQKKTYKEINHFVDTDLESPQIYFNFTKNLEKNISTLFKDITNKYTQKYRVGLYRCFDKEDVNEIDLNCYNKWFNYL